jgi:hypothetical protein
MPVSCRGWKIGVASSLLNLLISLNDLCLFRVHPIFFHPEAHGAHKG